MPLIASIDGKPSPYVEAPTAAARADFTELLEARLAEGGGASLGPGPRAAHQLPEAYARERDRSRRGERHPALFARHLMTAPATCLDEEAMIELWAY